MSKITEKNTTAKCSERPAKRTRKEERNAITQYRANMKGQHTFQSAFIELYHYSGLSSKSEEELEEEDVTEITHIYNEILAQEQIFALTPFQRITDIRYTTNLNTLTTEELMLLRDYYTITLMKMNKLDEELSKRKKIKKVLPKPKLSLALLCSAAESIQEEERENVNCSSLEDN